MRNRNRVAPARSALFIIVAVRVSRFGYAKVVAESPAAESASDCRRYYIVVTSILSPSFLLSGGSSHGLPVSATIDNTATVSPRSNRLSYETRSMRLSSYWLVYAMEDR